ncbi:MAG: alpha/beta hydrolase [Halieaceae bacterium]|nr:alpha/beta hydrolase [Halieaceae bacterium]
MASELFKALIDSLPGDFADPAADFLQVRSTMAPFHGHPTSADLRIDIRQVGGVRSGWYELEHHADGQAIALHYHGGAYVSCPLDVYHFYAEIIARALGMPVVMPDYRLAPEHPFPAAPMDCLAAYRGLLELGINPESIVVLGESCGGGLALDALVQARAEGLPMPACFVSLTGWFDLDVAPPPGRDPFLTPQWVRNRGMDFTAGSIELDNPRVSVCNAALEGLPHLYLQVGQFDTMAPGALKLAERATLAGVDVTLESWPGMIQGWHGLVTAGIPEAEHAWAAIRQFVEGKLDSSAATVA